MAESNGFGFAVSANHMASFAGQIYNIVDDVNGDRRPNPTKGTPEANARLIAAAPDLLAALEQAVTSMQDSGYSNSHLAVRAARAAIAKTQGERA
jgi:hypothetical protein